MNATTIPVLRAKETSELITALAAVGVRTYTNLADDGHISALEAFGYVLDAARVKVGIQGAQDILKELDNADSETLALLKDQIHAGLVAVHLPARKADITEEVLLWIRDVCRSTIGLWNFIKTAPPTALPE